MKQGIENLKISIKTVWPVLIALVGITVYGIRRFDFIDTKLNHLNDYNWTLFDQLEWSSQVRAHYTNVPDPNAIFRMNRTIIKPTSAASINPVTNHYALGGK